MCGWVGESVCSLLGLWLLLQAGPSTGACDDRVDGPSLSAVSSALSDALRSGPCVVLRLKRSNAIKRYATPENAHRPTIISIYILEIPLFI